MRRTTITLMLFLAGVSGASAACNSSSTICDDNRVSTDRDNAARDSAEQKSFVRRNRKPVAVPKVPPPFQKKTIRNPRIIMDAPLKMPDYYGTNRSRNSLPDY